MSDACKEHCPLVKQCLVNSAALKKAAEELTSLLFEDLDLAQNHPAPDILAPQIRDTSAHVIKFRELTEFLATGMEVRAQYGTHRCPAPNTENPNICYGFTEQEQNEIIGDQPYVDHVLTMVDSLTP